MKIILDLDKLEELDITIEQYYFLALLQFKKLDTLVRYTEKYGEFSFKSVEDLKTKELIEYIEFKGDITSLKVTDKAIQFIESIKVESQEEQEIIKIQQFEQILQAYPKKTPNNRKLQSNVVVGRDKLIKSYFKNLRSTKCTHEQVIQAIQSEIRSRSTNGSANYFSMLSTYINQGLWVGYLDKEISKPQTGYLQAI